MEERIGDENATHSLLAHLMGEGGVNLISSPDLAGGVN